MNQDPKHISSLAPVKRALMQQHLQEALLAIVAAQGKPVTIPISALEAVASRYRLLIEVDGEGDDAVLTLTPEEFQLEIITPANLHRH